MFTNVNIQNTQNTTEYKMKEIQFDLHGCLGTMATLHTSWFEYWNTFTHVAGVFLGTEAVQRFSFCVEDWVSKNRFSILFIPLV